MVPSFKFSNHITLSFGTSQWINSIALIQPVSRAPIACPHKSIPSPGSSQCRVPPWLSPTNQFHHPIQSRAPMARPHNSIPSPTSSQCHTPMACPHKSIPSPRSSRAPPWRVPINQCHCPVPASVAHPHQSNPSPWSRQGRAPPWIGAVSARCSWLQVSAFQHYRNLPHRMFTYE